MSDQEISTSESDEVVGVCVALLRTTFAGPESEAMAEQMLATIEPLPVLGTLVGMASTLGVGAMGRERFVTALEAWRPGTRLGDNLEPLGPNDSLDRFPEAQDLMTQMLRLDRVRLEMVVRWAHRRLHELHGEG